LEQLNDLKRELKDIQSMKQHAGHVSRTHKEIDRIQQEIKNIEAELLDTGSVRTADDVQVELDALSGQL
jgi:DNA repair protein RAD50